MTRRARKRDFRGGSISEFFNTIGGERAYKGRVGKDRSPLRTCSKSGEVHGETLEIGERAVVEGAFVSSPQDHAGRAARLQRFAPAGRTQAPAVAGPQAGK